MIAHARWTTAITFFLWTASGSIAFSQATLSIKCGDGSVYTASTGTNSGSCNTGTATNGKWVACTDSNGNKSGANCANGCEYSDKAGSCTAKNAALPPGSPPKNKIAKTPAAQSAGAKMGEDSSGGNKTLTTPSAIKPGLLESGGGGSVATGKVKHTLTPATTSVHQ